MTQLTISAATGIDQSKISRIASGAIKNPRWDDAEALNVLYAQTINKQPVEPA
ncbi:helix-turn-helix domain-containing protein [Psychrobacter pygoscelis]|uniref:helix-turn-helix domain-containing protein n=1 Tax=Psychrobacter pygoscelis TaxID=2488563 RepID=UPI0013F4B592|nr:helix-turn-helix domain-containing protein [Psychrobacter pygoscelis]